MLLTDGRRRFKVPASDECTKAADSNEGFCVFQLVFGEADGVVFRRLATRPLRVSEGRASFVCWLGFVL